MQPKTKIIATIGPSTQSLQGIRSIYKEGARLLRMNMSHGDHTSHQKTVDLRNEIEKSDAVCIGIIADLCGPKIRIGDFAQDEITLVPGKKFILTTTKIRGDETRVYINYPNITQEIKVGAIIMLDDGKRSLKVTKILSATDIETTVIFGGIIKSRRGVNIPNANLSIPALTAKDKKDLAWAMSQKVDFIAISFVRSAKDIVGLRKILTANKSTARIIAKIETPEVVNAIDEILAVADAIMVARGDLAIEIGAENVPYVQKQIIKKCNDAGKPVITATQMLESMVRNQVPTRAEVSDVANAIFDGTDAVMLSEETAIGAYPVETVSIMAKTALRSEETFTTHKRIGVQSDNLVDSVSSSVVHVAEDIQATCIVALTESGSTARVISRYKPTQPIIAITPHLHSARHLLLSYGVIPLVVHQFKGVTTATAEVPKILIKNKLAHSGDRIILSAGVPFGQTGSTNMMVAITL